MLKNNQNNLTKDTYVYCTNCYNFRLDDEELPYCCYENKCDINDCEDGKTLKEKPYYDKL